MSPKPQPARARRRALPRPGEIGLDRGPRDRHLLLGGRLGGESKGGVDRRLGGLGDPVRGGRDRERHQAPVP